jgi:serine/threonine protein kinase
VDPSAQARFEREAKVLSMLQHPNIVNIFSVGFVNSRPYIVMQYVDGRTLGRVLAEDGKLPWRRAVGIMVQVCNALHAAHEQGIVHRDLKPDNVMLGGDDSVTVLDFGLSRLISESPNDAQKLTDTGMVVGSVHYLSPEACTGNKPDARSDVYSAGCILYEAITGKRAVDGTEPLSVLYSHVNDLPTRITPNDPTLPPELELIIFKALQKEQDARFQSMKEFSEALSALLNGATQKTSFAGVKLDAARKPRIGVSRKAIFACAATFLIISVAGFYALNPGPSWQSEQEKATLFAEAENHPEATKHFRQALLHAKTAQEKFDSQIGIALMNNPPGQDQRLNSEVAGILRDAMKNASTSEQRNQVRTLLGLLASAQRDFPLVIECLQDDPWSCLAKSSNPFFNGDNYRSLRRKSTLALAEAYLQGPRPQPLKAIDALKIQQRFEYSTSYSDVPGTIILANAYRQLGETARANEMLTTLLTNMPVRTGFETQVEVLRRSLDPQLFEEAMKRRGAPGTRPVKNETPRGLTDRLNPIDFSYNWDAPAKVSE